MPMSKFIYLSSYLSIEFSFYLCLCLSILYHLSICQSIHLSICLSFSPSIYLSFFLQSMTGSLKLIFTTHLSDRHVDSATSPSKEEADTDSFFLSGTLAMQRQGMSTCATPCWCVKVCQSDVELKVPFWWTAVGSEQLGVCKLGARESQCLGSCSHFTASPSAFDFSSASHATSAVLCWMSNPLLPEPWSQPLNCTVYTV